MKFVVEKPEDTISINDVCSRFNKKETHIGVSKGKAKFTITEMNNTFISNGERFSTLGNAIEYFIKHKCTVVMFDNVTELTNWMTTK